MRRWREKPRWSNTGHHQPFTGRSGSFQALRRMRDLCSADAGALMPYDGENFQAVATHGLPDEFVTMLRRPFRGASHQRLIDGERIVHVVDAKAIPWSEHGDVERAFVERTNLRTSLFVPLRKDTLLGFISADRHEVRPFSGQRDRCWKLRRPGDDRDGVARLLTEQRERWATDGHRRGAQVINASPGDLAPVFDAMPERRAAVRGGVWYLVHSRWRLSALSIPQRPRFQGLSGVSRRLDAGSLLNRAMREQTVLNVADLGDIAIPRWRLAECRGSTCRHPLFCWVHLFTSTLHWACSHLSARGAAVLRQADDCCGTRSGGDRDGECAADHRRRKALEQKTTTADVAGHQ
jgi:hypothetical protein